MIEIPGCSSRGPSLGSLNELNLIRVASSINLTPDTRPHPGPSLGLKDNHRVGFQTESDATNFILIM